MHRWVWLLSAAALATTVPIVTTAARADENEKYEKHEKEVKLEKIPAPARQGLLREAGGSPILKVEEEKVNGKTLYEGHVKKGDDMIGIRVDAAGKLIDKHSEKEEKKEK